MFCFSAPLEPQRNPYGTKSKNSDSAASEYSSGLLKLARLVRKSHPIHQAEEDANSEPGEALGAKLFTIWGHSRSETENQEIWPIL